MSRTESLSAKQPTANELHASTDPSLAEMLEDLAVLVGEAEQADARVRAHVALLRRKRATWAEIGQALRVSRQAAWQRFGSTTTNVS